MDRKVYPSVKIAVFGLPVSPPTSDLFKEILCLKRNGTGTELRFFFFLQEVPQKEFAGV